MSTTTVATCPDYCRDPDVGCDWWDRDGQPVRDHAGPWFGSIYTTYIEHRDGSTTREAQCNVHDDPMPAVDFRQLAADALAAAEWLEANQ